MDKFIVNSMHCDSVDRPELLELISQIDPNRVARTIYIQKLSET